jgi:hypothetical protein
MIKEITIVSLATTSILFLIAYSFMAKKSSKLAKEMSVLYIDNLALKKFIDKEADNKLTDQEIHNENFVKFLSDSREVAYTYIEEVQSKLNAFTSKVDPLISYFDEYGDTISVYRPDYDALKQISSAYKELVTIMPNEEIK